MARSTTPVAPKRRHVVGKAPDPQPKADEETEPRSDESSPKSAPAEKKALARELKVFPKFCSYLLLALLCLLFLAISFHALYAYGDDIRDLLKAVTRFRNAKAVDKMLGWRSGTTFILTRRRR